MDSNKLGIIYLFISTMTIVYSQDKKFWNSQAQETLKLNLNIKPITTAAKNTILFLGDGMGVSTVFAMRVLKGQLRNKPGEETVLEFEKWPNVAMSKTYSTNYQVSDSASTASAFLCGVKANSGTIGVDQSVQRGNCTTFSKAAELSSLAQWALAAGKSVGIITTTRITHASPAGTYAHTPNRSWESDADIPQGEKCCEDIAAQMIKYAKDFTVIFGGGRREFYPNTTPDPEYTDKKGRRKDGRNLISEWIQVQKSMNANYKYVHNLDGFNDIDTSKTDRVLGLFEYSHMQYEIDRAKDKEPSQSELIEKAINILARNSNGYFLFFEGGRIDHGHHANNAMRAITEGLAFEKAVETASKMTNVEETLLVVTADHSHVFTVGGYQRRGNPIFGKTSSTTTDGMPYTSILYGNGPGYARHNITGRPNITNIDTENRDYIQQSAVPMSSETHAGEDVNIFAIGPMAHLFRGVVEQNYIAHVIGYAMCIGSNKDLCLTNPYNAANVNQISYFYLCITLIVYKLIRP